MDRLDRMAVVLRLAATLWDKGSWCGETHLQKAIYFLQEAAGVPLGYRYLLYMHGPYSFDVGRELEIMRGYGYLQLEPQSPPYGAKLRTTDAALRVQALHHAVVERYVEALNRVADFLGDKGVVQLEKLSTALYVTLTQPGSSVDSRAVRVSELKPHIKESDAKAALDRVDSFLQKARTPVTVG